MMQNKSETAYKTIGEVSKLLGVPAHVLRFWEKKFKQISPYKNNGRRYYTASDIAIIENIQFLLYEKGLTIVGVNNHLAQEDEPSLRGAKQRGNPSLPSPARSVATRQSSLNINLDHHANKFARDDDRTLSANATTLKSILTTLKHTKAQLQDALGE